MYAVGVETDKFHLQRPGRPHRRLKFSDEMQPFKMQSAGYPVCRLDPGDPAFLPR